MKKYTLRAIIFSLAILFSMNSANAQSVEQIKAKIPFDFFVSGKKFEAGEYLFSKLLPYTNSSFWHLRQKKDTNQILINTLQGSTKRSDKKELLLTFNRYGNDYFLSSISNTADLYFIKRSKTEIEIARRLAQQKPQVVSINIPIK